MENLEGSKWNSFNILGSSTVNNWGFDINTTFDPEDPESEPVTTEFKMQSVLDRTKPQLAVPVALAGFRKVRWEVTNAGSSSTSMGSVHVAYCKASGDSEFYLEKAAEVYIETARFWVSRYTYRPELGRADLRVTVATRTVLARTVSWVR